MPKSADERVGDRFCHDFFYIANIAARLTRDYLCRSLRSGDRISDEVLRSVYPLRVIKYKKDIYFCVILNT